LPNAFFEFLAKIRSAEHGLKPENLASLYVRGGMLATTA
jgi:hypothetical protein